MKNRLQLFTILNIIVLSLTCFFSIKRYNEICYIWSYMCEIAICIGLLKYTKREVTLYLKYVNLLIIAIILLAMSNILVLMFHETSKWIARPFFWIVALSYLISFLVYGNAFIKGNVKISECFHTIVLITVSLLISLPVYPYYRLSYSAQYHNGILKHKHFVDGIYEEDVVYIEETGSYSSTIKEHNMIITIQYDVYPYIIAETDTIIVEHVK